MVSLSFWANWPVDKLRPVCYSCLMTQTIGIDVVNVVALLDGTLKIDVLFWGLHPDGRKQVFGANSLTYNNEASEHLGELIREMVRPLAEEAFRPFVPLGMEGEDDIWTFARERLEQQATASSSS